MDDMVLRDAVGEMRSASTDYLAWMLERKSRTSNTLTEWCNARLAYGLPAFPQGRWYD